MTAKLDPVGSIHVSKLSEREAVFKEDEGEARHCLARQASALKEQDEGEAPCIQADLNAKQSSKKTKAKRGTASQGTRAP